MVVFPYLAIVLLSMILFLAVMLIVSIGYMKSIIIISLISLLSASTYLVMSAPDVALTEGAVGACASSCILLLGLRYIKSERCLSWFTPKQLLPCTVICFILLIVLCCYSLALHPYGDASNVMNGGAAEYYITNVEKDIGIRALVTAILASYRGVDTFCETLVIFTAGLCVIFIFSQANSNTSTKNEE
jgi:multicomponent Na+:H+ antiporter subunit B